MSECLQRYNKRAIELLADLDLMSGEWPPPDMSGIRERRLMHTSGRKQAVDDDDDDELPYEPIRVLRGYSVGKNFYFHGHCDCC